MEKFSKTLHGYDPEEVNNFLDDMIKKVEAVVKASKVKDLRIRELESKLKDYNDMQEKLTKYAALEEQVLKYQGMEDTLKQAILMAQKTTEQMKLNTMKESEMLLNDAKKNASRIVNDALIVADATEREAEMLRRNINLFKRKLKDQLQTQLDMVDDIEKFDV